MKTVNSSDVLRHSIAEGNTCLKFSAEWCGPCRVVGEMISSIEINYPNVNFVEVDVDDIDDDNILTEYKIKNIPAIFFIKNGNVIDKNIGTINKDELINKLNTVFDNEQQ